MKINYRKTGTLTKAGLAVIEYDEKIKIPKRDQALITLPTSKGFEIFQADEGFQQFLFLSDSEGSGPYERQACWFGGTDELPFLVRLNPHNWKHLWAKDQFYETIRPNIIKQFEKIFGGQAKRQGDIFAYELPSHLQDMQQLQTILQIDGRNTNCNQFSRRSVYETRHFLAGEMTTQWNSIVARGILKAPDHADLKMENWHLLAQTQYLYDPPKAD